MTTLPALHTLWLHEVRNVFRPACAAGATVWDRAKAVTYLRERFVPRFRVEREAATNLLAILQLAEVNPLWDAGEVVEAQVERLTRLATFHQKADEFRTAAEELNVALEDWCGALDDTVNQVRESDLHLV